MGERESDSNIRHIDKPLARDAALCYFTSTMCGRYILEAVAILQKPYAADDLLRAIFEALQHKQ